MPGPPMTLVKIPPADLRDAAERAAATPADEATEPHRQALEGSAQQVHDRAASLAQEMRLAERLRTQARSTVMAVFADARFGKVPDIDATRPVVDAVVDSVLRRKGAMLCLARLKFKDDYTYMHSLSVCAMAAAVTHELGLDVQRCRSAGLAALMHDVGKSRVPLEVLNKAGSLTEAEWAIVRQHPALGHELLRQGRCAESEVLDACLHHHERLDGSGYPQRLSADAISPLTRVVAVCDVFDAMTSARPYKPAWDPAVALQAMAGWRGHFDRHVLAAFVRVVGVFPPGSLVRLASGRLAVVVDNDTADAHAPTVRVFYSTRAQEPLRPQLLDLALASCGDRIVALEPRERWNFPRLEALCDMPC